MSSRFSAARPKRQGENFARTHHHDTYENDNDSDTAGGQDPKRVKFDVRNPSALAPDAREDDAVLEADVIGGGGATKRGAVNLDGYDSDSDNETFHARSDRRSKNKKGDPNLLDQLDHYTAKDDEGAGVKSGKADEDEDEDDDDDDMFAADDDGQGDGGKGEKGEGSADAPALGSAAAKRKEKQVRFLDNAQIKGQELQSKSGGHVRLDERSGGESDSDNDSPDEEADVEEARRLAAQEEGVDDEVGFGGLKRNAPKVEAFNMKDEQEEGRFDADGNYIRKAADPDAVHDKWLDGLSRKEMKKAAEAHEKRELEAKGRRMEEDRLLTTDILARLIERLEKGETPLEALGRLGRAQKKKGKQNKKLPSWKLKQKKEDGEADGMDVDSNDNGKAEEHQDPEQVRIKEAIDAITDAADKLLGRNREEIYDEERELLIREWQRETGDDWVEPKAHAAEANGGENDPSAAGPGKMWEFRWTDGRDDADKQGPFDGVTMKAWQDAGYFGEGVEFRLAGDETGWTRVADFES